MTTDMESSVSAAGPSFAHYFEAIKTFTDGDGYRDITPAACSARELQRTTVLVAVDGDWPEGRITEVTIRTNRDQAGVVLGRSAAMLTLDGQTPGRVESRTWMVEGDEIIDITSPAESLLWVHTGQAAHEISREIGANILRYAQLVRMAQQA